MTVLGENDAACRARIGIVVPSVNTVMEPWAQRTAPPGVDVHFSRMFIPDLLSRETLIEMDRTEGMDGIRQVASARPNVIAYGCTASSIVQGVAYDQHLREDIETRFKVAATTAAHAILQAADALGVRKVSLVSPYTSAVAEAEHAYFESAGTQGAGRRAPRYCRWLPTRCADARRAFSVGAQGLEWRVRCAHHLLPEYPLACRDRGPGRGARQTGHHVDASYALARSETGHCPRSNRGIRSIALSPLIDPTLIMFVWVFRRVAVRA